MDNIEKFIKELIRDDKSSLNVAHLTDLTFNGIRYINNIAEKDMYISRLNALYDDFLASIGELPSKQLDILLTRLNEVKEGHDDIDEGYLEGMRQDLFKSYNEDLKKDIETISFFHNLLAIQESYINKAITEIKTIIKKESVPAEKIMSKGGENSMTEEIHKANQPITQVDRTWMTARELCDYFPGLVFNNVKDRQWRRKVGFPCKQPGGYKSKVMYNKDMVEEWLKEGHQ